jgi:hypothetical protein
MGGAASLKPSSVFNPKTSWSQVEDQMRDRVPRKCRSIYADIYRAAALSLDWDVEVVDVHRSLLRMRPPGGARPFLVRKHVVTPLEHGPARSECGDKHVIQLLLGNVRRVPLVPTWPLEDGTSPLPREVRLALAKAASTKRGAHAGTNPARRPRWVIKPVDGTQGKGVRMGLEDREAIRAELEALDRAAAMDSHAWDTSMDDPPPVDAGRDAKARPPDAAKRGGAPGKGGAGKGGAGKGGAGRRPRRGGRGRRRGDRAQRATPVRYLLQEQVLGHDYRVLMVDGKVLDVARRVPAAVVGDGSRTTAALVRRVNAVRARLRLPAVRPAARCGPFCDVPRRGAVRPVQDKANVSLGGEAHAVPLARVHPKNVAMFERCAAVYPKQRILGIDFLGDVTQPFTRCKGYILELNSRPQILCHCVRGSQVSLEVPRLILSAAAVAASGR